jgi:enamine deaminase RidA (YjgF/YER057c/UK114 family)
VGNNSSFQLFAPSTLHSPRGYSHAAKLTEGKPVFIAGQVALDKSGDLVGKDDLAAQAEQVFQNLKAILDAAGGSFRDVVKLNVYVLDISRLPAYRDVRDRFVDTKNPPTSTAVQVSALFRPEFLIEIEAVAALG